MTANLPISRNWGEAYKSTNPLLINELDDMYFDVATAISRNIKRDVVSGADPAANSPRNAIFSIGDITVRTDTNQAWIMTSRTTPNAVTWTLIT